MQFHDFVLTLIAFISEFLGTLSGFGSSTFFVPSALLIESFQLVLVLTAILHCFGNFSRIILFRKDLNKESFFLLVTPTLLFTGLGAVLTITLPKNVVFISLGFVLITLSLLFFIGESKIPKLPKWFSVLLSAISGFTTGFVGTGGAIRGVALTAMQIPKNSFVITSASIDLASDGLRAAIYLKNGFMDWNQWFYLPLLGFAAIIGSWLGQKALSKINQKQFEKIVAFFIFLSGLLMLMNNT